MTVYGCFVDVWDTFGTLLGHLWDTSVVTFRTRVTHLGHVHATFGTPFGSVDTYLAAYSEPRASRRRTGRPRAAVRCSWWRPCPHSAPSRTRSRSRSWSLPELRCRPNRGEQSSACLRGGWPCRWPGLDCRRSPPPCGKPVHCWARAEPAVFVINNN